MANIKKALARAYSMDEVASSDHLTPKGFLFSHSDVEMTCLSTGKDIFPLNKHRDGDYKIHHTVKGRLVSTSTITIKRDVVERAAVTLMSGRSFVAYLNAPKNRLKKKRENFRLSGSEIEKVLDLYREGVSYAEIRGEIGVSFTTISRLASEAGLSRYNKTENQEPSLEDRVAELEAVIAKLKSALL